MRQVCKNHPFYKEYRQIIESKHSRRSEMVSNALNRSTIQTSFHRPDICLRPRCNLVFPSEKSSESSNYSNDADIGYYDLQDENYEHPILSADSITPV